MIAPPTASATPRRSTRAVVFLTTIALAIGVALLGWGRIWGRPDPGAFDGTRPGPSLREPWPAEGGRWPQALDDADREYMLSLFQNAFAMAGRGEGRPDLSTAPEACAAPHAIPLVTTAFTQNGKSYRFVAHKKSIAESVAAAAVDTWVRMGRPAPDTRKLRLRIDVIREALPMSPRRRLRFVQQYSAVPYGVAICVKRPVPGVTAAPFAISLAADAVRLITGMSGPRARLAEAVCHSVGLKPEDWLRTDAFTWRVRSESFINDVPGGSKPMPSPHGLAPVDPQSTTAQATALRAAADYLIAGQDRYGAFPTLRTPNPRAPKLGCESLVEQADTTAALADSWTSSMGAARLDALTAAFKGVAFLMQSEALQAEEERHMKFAGRKETCRDVVELEATASVLTALCRLHAAVTGPGVPTRIAAAVKARSDVGRPTVDLEKLAKFLADGGDRALLADIESLANFLVFMQRDDGLFDVRYIPEIRQKITPLDLRDDLAMQARAARALCLARHRLGKTHIAYIAVADKALRALAQNNAGAEDTVTSSEARWVLTAVAEHRASLDSPPAELIAWAGRIARARHARQLTAEDLPNFTFIGGTTGSFPPEADATADDLVVFATACTLGRTLLEQNLTAAEQAAGYLMRLQYAPANSYYIAGKRGGLGGFRRRHDRGVVPLGATAAALHGFTTLVLVEMNLEAFYD
jgi:hypothetical protein